MPVVLFIRGGWHTLAAYEKFLGILESEGYTVVAPDLPSAAQNTSADPAGDDVRYFASLAAKLADQGHEILVIAHSYGGTIATDAMAGLGLSARKVKGLQGGVKRMVYVAAFMLERGTCLEDLAPADSLPWCQFEVGLPFFSIVSPPGWMAVTPPLTNLPPGRSESDHSRGRRRTGVLSRCSGRCAAEHLGQPRQAPEGVLFLHSQPFRLRRDPYNVYLL